VIEHLDKLAERAASLLGRRLGDRLTLDTPVLLKDAERSLVLRYRVRSAVSPIASVIVKQLRDEGVVGFTDWASLEFLSEIPEAKGLAPGFLGGDVADPLFLMEDLGDCRSLEQLLNEGDREAAGRALEELAAQMARLHGVTLSREEQYGAIRRALPGADGLGRQREADRWLASRSRVEEWLDAAGCPAPRGFAACMVRIARTFAEPGPFLCFTHGDPAPTNNHLDAEGRVRLLDFEYGAFRHALYDLTGWNILCPLPPRCVELMSRRFRAELGAECPIVEDDAAYADAWGHLCAFRALAILTWIDPSVLQENRPQVGPDWTARHAVLAAVSRMQSATGGIAALQPVHEAAGGLAKRLSRRWSELTISGEVMPQWPAFAGPPDRVDEPSRSETAPCDKTPSR
jgi:hypothetical protein